MPTYDYVCKSCKNSFERILKIADREFPTSEPCSECGGEIVMSISAPTLVSGVRGPQSAPNGFKDVLKNIHKGAGKESKIDV